MEGAMIAHTFDYYSMATAAMRINGHTPLVHASRGVGEGDPLSPLLFNLAWDKIYKRKSLSVSFWRVGVSVFSMGFANDIVVKAETPGGLRSEVDVLRDQL